MTKKLIFIFFLFITTISFSQNKSGIVEYYIADINVVFKEGNSQNDNIRQIIEAGKKQIFELKFNDNTSIFQCKEILESDQTDDSMLQLSKIAYTTSETFYTNLSKKELLIKTNENELIKSKTISNGWEITKETKLIDKYLCYKAEFKKPIIGRDGKEKTILITAWFAPSINFSFGPKEYSGLPGLILELKEKYTTYLAKKISIQNENIIIDFPKGKSISEKEYNSKFKKLIGL
jgi:GLPGLI family protein